MDVSKINSQELLRNLSVWMNQAPKGFEKFQRDRKRGAAAKKEPPKESKPHIPPPPSKSTSGQEKQGFSFKLEIPSSGGGGGSSSSSKTEIGDSDFLDPVDPVDSSELSMVWHPDSQVTVFFLFLEPFGRPRPRLIMGLRISGFSNMIVGVGKMVGKSGSETEAGFWVCALVVC